jgi:hypothetical protein
MYNKDRGSIPLTYGVDVKMGLTLEEQTHVDRSYDLWLQQRSTEAQRMNSLFKECVEALTRDKNRNEKVIQHKLEKLPEQLVGKVFQKVLEHKVTVAKKYEELDCCYGKQKDQPVISTNISESNIPASGRSTMSSRPEKKAAASLLMPKSLFWIKRDRLNNYRRFDKKFQGMFDKALEDYAAYKKEQVKHLQEAAKMQFDIAKEMQNLKVAIAELQDAQDTNEDNHENVLKEIEGLHFQDAKIEDKLMAAKRLIKELSEDADGKFD